MKLSKNIGLLLATSAMALTIGLTVNFGNIKETRAAESLAYSTGFESAEGFTVSTVYNNTTERVQGPTGEEWGTIMGTATTTAPLAGAQQIQLRSYAGNMTVGRAYPKFSFANLTRVTFATKAYASGSTMTVEYSLDNSTWAAMTLTGTYSTAASTIEAAMPEELSGTEPTVYFRINHTLVNVANRMYIDTVQVYTEQTFGTLDHISINTPATKTSFFVGDTFASSGLVLIGYDGANEETANTQLIYEGFTTDYDTHLFTSEDIGTNKTVTITYSGKTTTYTIDVAAVPTGEYTLFLSADDFVTTSYAANNGSHSKDSADTLGNIDYFTNQVMENSSNTVIQFQTSTGYIYNTTDFVAIHSIIIETGATAAVYSNNLVIKEGTSINPTAGSIVSASLVGTTYTYTFSSGMGFFNISNGGATTYIDSIEIIPTSVVDDADTWASSFLSSTGAICTDNNTTNLTNLSNSWTTLSTSYDSLSADAQNYIYKYNDATLTSAKARYQYIYEKYAYVNFMTNYAGTPVFSAAQPILPNSIATSDSKELGLIVTVSIAFLSLLFYVKFRKSFSMI